MEALCDSCKHLKTKRINILGNEKEICWCLAKEVVCDKPFNDMKGNPHFIYVHERVKEKITKDLGCSLWDKMEDANEEKCSDERTQ